MKSKRADFQNLSPETQKNITDFVNGGFLQNSLAEETQKRKNFQETPLDADFFGSLMNGFPQPQEPQLAESIIPVADKPTINPAVKEYLQTKMGNREPALVNTTPAAPVAASESKPADISNPLSKFSDEARAKALAASKDGSTSMAIAQFLGGFGDSLAGRSPSETANRFNQYRENQRDQTIGQFDRDKKNSIEDYNVNRQVKQNLDSDAQKAREMDLNSEESKMAQALAKKMNPGADVSGLTASKFKELSPVLEKMYSIEQNKLARQDAAALRNETREQRQYEKNQALETTYGTARTPDDAKQLKAAAEMKSKFDSQLQELISLRKDKGVEYLDRNAVTRAEQLSNDLLLTYKDLSKLGVLSDKDTKILNAIIPADPLSQDWAPFQDPTLHQLEKFQGDVNNDFNNRLNQRLRDPNNSQRQQQQSNSDSRVDNFMKKNGITDRAEAVRILKENGKI